jgi:hypothetical protein
MSDGGVRVSDKDVRAAVVAALTNEDEIAHGEAVAERDGVRVALGVCAYDDDPWPCRTQRAIDRLLAVLAAKDPE